MAHEPHPHDDGFFHEVLDETVDAISHPQLETEWWFNVKTGEVEHGPQSLHVDRVGPFRTREEALRANEIIAERARHWAEQED